MQGAPLKRIEAEKSTKQSRLESFLSTFIKNKKERKAVTIAIYTAVALLILGLSLAPTLIIKYIPLHTNDYISMHQYVGSTSRIGFFFAVAIYPIFYLLKLKKLDRVKDKKIDLKQILRFLAKIARQWHVPVAIVSLGVVLIHAYLAILNGWRWDGGYISGMLSLLVLGVLSVTGLLRYKKLDKKWHLILGLSFVALFIIHTLFSPVV